MPTSKAGSRTSPPYTTTFEAKIAGRTARLPYFFRVFPAVVSRILPGSMSTFTDVSTAEGSTGFRPGPNKRWNRRFGILRG